MRDIAVAREFFISLLLITDAIFFDVNRNDETVSGVHMRLMISKYMSSPRPLRPPGILKDSGTSGGNC